MGFLRAFLHKTTHRHVACTANSPRPQPKGTDSWERYLEALEKATPPIRALGITDYYSTEMYERVLEAKRNGRLAGCDLIVPSIEDAVERRDGPGPTSRRAQAASLGLTFKAHRDTYCCDRDDLIRLGRRTAARRRGSEPLSV